MEMRADRHPILPRADDDLAPLPAAPLWSRWYKLIIGGFIAFAGPRILGLLTVIFLAIPTGTSPELGLNPGSSLWSLNISTSHSKLITVEYPPLKLLSSFDGQLALSCPSVVSIFTQGPGCVTSLRAKAQSTLAIVTDWGMNSLVTTLNVGEVTIDVAAKAKWRLCLGPRWVAVFDVDVSCTGLTFAAPSNSEGGGDRMILKGTLSWSLDIIPQLRCLFANEVDEKLSMPSITNFSEPSPPGCGGDEWLSHAGQERGSPGLACSAVAAMLFLTLPGILRPRWQAVKGEAVLAAWYGWRKFMMRTWSALALFD